jgi:hypothetical protein
MHIRTLLLPIALLSLTALQGQDPSIPTPPDPPAKPTEPPCVKVQPKKPTWKDVFTGHVISTVVRTATGTIDEPIARKTRGKVDTGVGQTAGTAVAEAAAPKTCQPEAKKP